MKVFCTTTNGGLIYNTLRTNSSRVGEDSVRDSVISVRGLR